MNDVFKDVAESYTTTFKGLTDIIKAQKSVIDDLEEQLKSYRPVDPKTIYGIRMSFSDKNDNHYAYYASKDAMEKAYDEFIQTGHVTEFYDYRNACKVWIPNEICKFEAYSPINERERGGE
jgi:hypothetical protein